MNGKVFEKKEKNKLQKKFGAHIIQLRKLKQISPSELARRSFMETSNLAKIEGGEANLTLYTIIKIANALDISLKEFFTNFDYKTILGKK